MGPRAVKPHQRIQLPTHEESTPLGGDIDRAEVCIPLALDSPEAQKGPCLAGALQIKFGQGQLTEHPSRISDNIRNQQSKKHRNNQTANSLYIY